MNIKILNRWTLQVIFECEADSMKAAVELACKQGVSLRDSDLSDSDLSGSDLRGSDLSGVPKIPNIHQSIYAAASQPHALDMSTWHGESACGTTHCRAGWVVALAGDGGKALEWAMGTPTAATLIYLASDPDRWKNERLPDFYCENGVALADMKRMADEESAAATA